MATSEHVDVAIVGGGIAGLTAAWELRDLDVVVLESGDRLGGRIRSERRGDYWLNAGAHVFGSPESASGRLLAELEVAAEPVPGRLAAVALNGKIVARGPVESFPFRLPLTVPERVALVRAGLRLRSAVRSYGAIAAPQPGEDPSERQLRMLAFLDDRSFRDFIGPLPDDVAAIFRSTLTRSSGEPDELAAGYGIGYFHLVWNRGEGLSRNIIGGSGVIIDALSRSAGDRARVGTHVTRVETTSDGVRIGYTVDGEQRELSARAAIVATPAYVTREIVKGLPDDTAAALAQIPYGPYVVGAFLTNEDGPMPWDDVYALATPKRSFSMLFNTANVLRRRDRPRRPGGSLMVYAASALAQPLLDLDDAVVTERFLSDLHALYPGTREIVDEVLIQRWPRGLPYPRPGRSRLQRALTRELGPVQLAGDYLGTWYTETAVQTALAAAAGVRRRLAAGGSSR